jgi:hypothetical protein
MKPPIIFIALALVAGIAIGFFVHDTSDMAESKTLQNTVAASDDLVFGDNLVVIDSSTTGIAELKRLLQDEIRARKSLELKLDALSREVSEFKSNAQPKSTQLSSQGESGQSVGSESDSDWFNEQALVDSGMTGGQARELKIFFEQQELQQLYLRDQAIREGWDRQKYREQFQVLNDEEDSLKDRLGDAAYDAYLYASGQSNRVAVSSVLATAPAGAAGILAGDHILRYDNQRIYSGLELRQATTGGNASDSVPVEIERDGEVLEFYVIRGPLGIRMNSVSVAP